MLFLVDTWYAYLADSKILLILTLIYSVPEYWVLVYQSINSLPYVCTCLSYLQYMLVLIFFMYANNIEPTRPDKKKKKIVLARKSLYTLPV